MIQEPCQDFKRRLGGHNELYIGVQHLQCLGDGGAIGFYELLSLQFAEIPGLIKKGVFLKTEQVVLEIGELYGIEPNVNGNPRFLRGYFFASLSLFLKHPELSGL